MTIEERTKSEKQRLTALLFDCGISENQIQALDAVIENASWMKCKLDDARDAIKNTNVVISFDNGDGQKSLRENPLFKGYEALWKAYLGGMSKIIELVPKSEGIIPDEKDEPKTVLQLMREKHRREA